MKNKKTKNNQSPQSTLDALLASIERLFLSVVIGLVAPLLLGLAGWWGSIPFVPEGQILYFALGGVLAGVMLDIIFLRRWTRSAMSASIIWPVAVFLFYAICVFGFFMAVPVFQFSARASLGILHGDALACTESRSF